MYSYIKGLLTEIEQGSIVVEAGGVGYGICIPASVLQELPPTGTEIRIYTHFSVREDGQTLYGFLYKEDREMFRSLITVSGIGPKGALSILGVMPPDDLRMAIACGDVKAISRAPGIGKKTAERVILDLRDKMTAVSAGAVSGMQETGGTAEVRNQGPAAEAIEALTMLGFSRMEAGRAVGMIRLSDGMTTEEVIKNALKAIRQ